MGDPTKAYNKLNWKPETSLEEMITEMIENDKKEALMEYHLKNNNFEDLPSEIS